MNRFLFKMSLIFILANLLGCYMGGRGLAPIQFPKFSWPPPKASAFTALPDSFFRVTDKRKVLLREIDNKLSKALRFAGYVEKSYYAVPDGFALVSRLEQINPDGKSKNDLDRWTINIKPLQKFSLTSYLRALFTSQPGFFRIIVFIVTPQPFYQDNIEVSMDEIKSWMYSGLNKLPEFVSIQEYTKAYSCMAFIYELKKENGREAVTIIPGNLSALMHLEKSMIMKGLAL